MNAEAITTALLRAHAPLVALIGTRLGPGPLPQATALPAVATNLVSSNPRNPAAGGAAKRHFVSRMQITVLGESYARQKQLIALVSAACSYYRGDIAGATEVSVVPDIIGPDFRDDSAAIFMQTIDFRVFFNVTTS